MKANEVRLAEMNEIAVQLRTLGETEAAMKIELQLAEVNKKWNELQDTTNDKVDNFERKHEVSLADLQNETDAERSYKKFKLSCEDVQGKNCLTQFYGMNLTTDKLRSMVKKWQTLIEAHVDVKTTDGYLLRVFCIGFTQKQQHSTKKHCYAQSQQIRQIRKKMVDIIAREVSSVDLKEVVNKLIPDSMSMDIQKACQGIYPLHDVHIRKVKVQRRPRFDLAKLMELHGEGSGKATTTTTDPNTGEVVERPEGYEPPVQEVV